MGFFGSWYVDSAADTLQAPSADPFPDDLADYAVKDEGADTKEEAAPRRDNRRSSMRTSGEANVLCCYDESVGIY